MKKTAFLFCGQGAQYPGMMKDLAETIPEADVIFENADRTLGRDIRGLCFNGTQEELNLTHNTQPCILAADIAACRALTAFGIKPDAVAGFSLGEYGALTEAGCIAMDDIFPLIQKRADYMQKAVPVGEGAMAAIVGKTLEEVEQLCQAVEGYVIPANLNCPGQIVISGEAGSVHSVVNLARERKIKAMILPVSAPFHCELLKPAADRLAVELNKIEIRNPTMPIYMNVDGEPECSAEKIREKLILQAKSPVYWEKTLRNMYRNGFRVFVECGPGKTLSGFVKKTFKNLDDVISLRVSDLETMKAATDFFQGA